MTSGPPHGRPHGPPHGTPHGPPHGTPYGTPHGTPHGPPHGTPHVAPHVSARLAVLYARGQAGVGAHLLMRSVIGSEFQGRIVDTTPDGAIIPEISGRAWITGVTHHLVDPDDPWPTGYRVADTWPGG